MTETERKKRRATAKRRAERYLGRTLSAKFWRHFESSLHNDLSDEEDIEQFEEDCSPGSRYLKTLALALESSGANLSEGHPPEYGTSAPLRPSILARQVHLVNYVAARTPAITHRNLAAGSLAPCGRIAWSELCGAWNAAHTGSQYAARSMDKAFRRAIKNPEVCARYFLLMREEEARALEWLAAGRCDTAAPGWGDAQLREAARRLVAIQRLLAHVPRCVIADYEVLERSLARAVGSGVDGGLACAVRFYSWWWVKDRSLGITPLHLGVLHPRPEWITHALALLLSDVMPYGLRIDSIENWNELEVELGRTEDEEQRRRIFRRLRGPEDEKAALNRGES